MSAEDNLSDEQFFHNSPPFNRFSIRKHGLVAAQPDHADDLPHGVYLHNASSAQVHAQDFGEDTWEVHVPHGAAVHPDPVHPDGAKYVPQDIPSSHVRLVAKGSLSTYFGGDENVPSRSNLRKRLKGNNQ